MYTCHPQHIRPGRCLFLRPQLSDSAHSCGTCFRPFVYLVGEDEAHHDRFCTCDSSLNNVPSDTINCSTIFPGHCRQPPLPLRAGKRGRLTSALGYLATSLATSSKGNGASCSTRAMAMSVRFNCFIETHTKRAANNDEVDTIDRKRER